MVMLSEKVKTAKKKKNHSVANQGLVVSAGNMKPKSPPALCTSFNLPPCLLFSLRLCVPRPRFERGEKKRKRKIIDHTLVTLTTAHANLHQPLPLFALSSLSQSLPQTGQTKSPKPQRRRGGGGGVLAFSPKVLFLIPQFFPLVGGSIPYLISSAPSPKAHGKSPEKTERSTRK